MLTNTALIDGSDGDTGGYVVRSPLGPWYNQGDLVHLTAVPYASCCQTFDHWEGTGSTSNGDPIDNNTNATIEISVEEDYSLTAVLKDWTAWKTEGIEIFYVEPATWNDDGYLGDRFDALIMNPDFSAIDPTGVQVREDICYISDNFPGGLTPDEKQRLGAHGNGEFIVYSGDRTVVENGQQTVKSGLWLTGEQVYGGDYPADAHYIDPRAYETIQGFYQHNNSEKEIRVKQRYYISNWGNNNPDDFPTAYIGETTLVFKFNKIIVDACYDNAAMLCHVRVEKGGVHHPCAWGTWPQWYDWPDKLVCLSSCSP